MRISYAVAAVVLVAGVVVLWMKPWRHEAVPTTEAPETKVETTNAPTARAHQKTFYEAPRDPLPTTNLDASISPQCRDLWLDIRKINLGDQKTFGADHFQVPDTSQCTGLPENLSQLQKGVLANCSDPAEPITDEKLKAARAGNCQISLFYYRAQITDYMTKDQNPSDISDMKVLTDKLFANFIRSPKDAAAIAKRMLELDPEYYPAAQTLLFADLIDAADTAKGNPNDPAWQKVEADMERSKRINPTDPQRGESEMFMLAARNESPEVVRARAQEYATANPKSSLGPYYVAWSYYSANDPNRGWQAIQQALRDFPGDPRIREVADGIKKNPNFYKSKDKTNSPFKATLTTGVNPSPNTN